MNCWRSVVSDLMPDKVPAQIEFRGELPKNLVGKVLRRLLVEA